MQRKLDEIRGWLHDGETDKAISGLKSLSATDCEQLDEVFFLLGNAYCKKNDWQQAINAYCQAVDINPNSPAKLAYERINEILNFYNHDIYNP